jgi:hypothetical protein
MGGGFSTICSSCGDDQAYYLGQGFRYSSPFEMMDLFNGKAKQNFEKIVLYEEISSSTCINELYACQRCNTLHNRLYVKVEYGEGEVFETKFRCSECRQSINKTENSHNDYLLIKEKIYEHYNCRKCGSKTLKQGLELPCWD